MTLLIILACVFAGITLMLVLGERLGRPMSRSQQTRFSKISYLLVFIILIVSMIKSAFF